MAYVFDDAAMQGAAAGGVLAGLLALGVVFFVVFIVLALAMYIYMALALMAIAKRTKTPNGWLAWIPIANLYLMTQIARVPWWTMFAFLLSWVPVVGGLVVAAVSVWWWWKIAERRKKEGWWGILMLIPIVNLVLIGILAWSKD